MQTYLTINGTACAEIEEKKSVFIANIGFVSSESAAMQFLQSIKAQHRTANHNVYAYILNEGNKEKYSDDGEPAKTAGLPILQLIHHANLKDCIIVVTRYFGGTLLGTGGLVRAYSTAAKAAIEKADIVSMKQCTSGTLLLDYPLYEQAARILKENGAQIDDVDFTSTVKIIFLLRIEDCERIKALLNELSKGKANLEFTKPFFAPF